MAGSLSIPSGVNKVLQLKYLFPLPSSDPTFKGEKKPSCIPDDLFCWIEQEKYFSFDNMNYSSKFSSYPFPF